MITYKSYNIKKKEAIKSLKKKKGDKYISCSFIQLLMETLKKQDMYIRENSFTIVI